MVSISIRRSRFSYPLVHKLAEFTANIPRVADLEAVKYCGTKSGRDVNKFRELGLTPVNSPPLEFAPMIDEFPLALACRVKHELGLGSHHIFIAEVVGIHCDQSLVRPSQRPDPFPEEQIVYLDGKYWRLKQVETELTRPTRDINGVGL